MRSTTRRAERAESRPGAAPHGQRARHTAATAGRLCRGCCRRGAPTRSRERHARARHRCGRRRDPVRRHPRHRAGRRAYPEPGPAARPSTEPTTTAPASAACRSIRTSCASTASHGLRPRYQRVTTGSPTASATTASTPPSRSASNPTSAGAPAVTARHTVAERLRNESRTVGVQVEHERLPVESFPVECVHVDSLREGAAAAGAAPRQAQGTSRLGPFDKLGPHQLSAHRLMPRTRLRAR